MSFVEELVPHLPGGSDRRGGSRRRAGRSASVEVAPARTPLHDGEPLARARTRPDVAFSDGPPAHRYQLLLAADAGSGRAVARRDRQTPAARPFYDGLWDPPASRPGSWTRVREGLTVGDLHFVPEPGA